MAALLLLSYLQASAPRSPHTNAFPKVLHQTWKTSAIPPEMAKYVASWKRHNPEWTLRLWTDGEILRLIKAEMPYFAETALTLFDSGVERADIARYVILYLHGGVYADLDMEALQPIGPLLERHALSGTGVVLGAEPTEHARAQGGRNLLVCNAVIASVKGHPFWREVFAHIERKAKELAASKAKGSWVSPVDTTGPVMLTTLLENKPVAFDGVRVELSHVFYPVPDGPHKDDPVTSKLAFTAHRWVHLWLRNHKKKEPEPSGYGYDDGYGYGTPSPPAPSAGRGVLPSGVPAEVRVAKRPIGKLMLRGGECMLPVTLSSVAQPSSERYANGTCIASWAYGSSVQTVGVMSSKTSGIGEECSGDLTTFCRNVSSGKGRTHTCLVAHRLDLSDPCHLAMYGMRKGQSPTRPTHALVNLVRLGPTGKGGNTTAVPDDATVSVFGLCPVNSSYGGAVAAGRVSVGHATTGFKHTTVKFATAFSAPPLVFATARCNGKLADTFAVSMRRVSKDEFQANVRRLDGPPKRTGVRKPAQDWQQDLLLDYMAIANDARSKIVHGSMIVRQFLHGPAKVYTAKFAAKQGLAGKLPRVFVSVRGQDNTQFDDVFLATLCSVSNLGFSVIVTRVDSGAGAATGWGQTLHVDWFLMAE